MQHNNESSKNVDLTFIRTLIDNKEPSVDSRIFLVEGKDAHHEHIFSKINRMVNDSSKRTVMLIRLGESITTQNDAFHPYLMKRLAQTIEDSEWTPKDIEKIIKSYLNPFVKKEKNRKVGFSQIFSFGYEEKLVKKDIDVEDIKRDYGICFKQLNQNRIKLLIIVDTIETISEDAKKFLIKFVNNYDNSTLILGGTNKNTLSKFLDNCGQSKYFQYSFLNDLERSLTSKISDEEVTDESDHLANIIVNAFDSKQNIFRNLDFNQKGRVTGKLLPGFASKKFDLALLGHLRMRYDHPKPICTDYDDVILIKVLKQSIKEVKILEELCDAAYEIREEGISFENDRRYVPWDTFIFVFITSVSDVVLEDFKHHGYANVFLIMEDSTFRNLTPHKWMDKILEDVCKSLKRKVSS